MKKAFCLILLCSTMSTMPGAAPKKQPIIPTTPKRCCPNGECVKQSQTYHYSDAANTKRSNQTNTTNTTSPKKNK